MDFRAYLMKVITTALLCSIVSAFFSESTGTGKIIKFIGSIILACSILSPVISFSFQEVSDYFQDIKLDADLYVEEGKEIANTQMASIIKHNTESYIEDKAAYMHCDVEAEVTVAGEDLPVPVHVALYGEVSPYTKQVLSEYIANDLGVPKENQSWN